MLIESSTQERKVPGRRPARVVTMDLSGEFDPASAPDAEAAIVAAIADVPAAVLVDLRRLTGIDSTGVDCLLRAKAAAGTCDVAFGIRSGEGPAYAVLALTGAAAAIGLADAPDALLDPSWEV